MKALRHTKTGELYPMHEHLAKHPDVEFVDIGSDGKVIEVEEVGPAAAEPAKPSPRKSTRRKTEADTSGDDLSIGDE